MNTLYYLITGFVMAFMPQFMQLATEGKLTEINEITSVQWVILIGMSILGALREYRNRMQLPPPPENLSEDQLRTLNQLQTNMSKRNQG